jgi:hypothetical protein
MGMGREELPSDCCFLRSKQLSAYLDASLFSSRYLHAELLKKETIVVFVLSALHLHYSPLQ